MKIKRDTFDDIYTSHRNGQMRQMVNQLDELDGYERAEMLKYVAVDLNQPEVAIDMAQVYFRIKAR